jgi:hypothetical protein
VRGFPLRVGLDLGFDLELLLGRQRAIEVVAQRDDDLVVDVIDCWLAHSSLDMALHLLA